MKQDIPFHAGKVILFTNRFHTPSQAGEKNLIRMYAISFRYLYSRKAEITGTKKEDPASFKKIRYYSSFGMDIAVRYIIIFYDYKI